MLPLKYIWLHKCCKCDNNRIKVVYATLTAKLTAIKEIKMRPEIKIMAMTVLVLCMIVFSLLPFVAQASGNHHESNQTIINIAQPSITINNQSGVALALSANATLCDAGTKKNQLSVGVGEYEGSQAISVAGCKSFDNITVKVLAGSEDGDKGYSVGFGVKF